MTKLKMKSFRYMLPYLVLCLLAVIGKWDFCKEVLMTKKLENFFDFDEDTQITLVLVFVIVVVIVVLLTLVFSGKCQKKVYQYIRGCSSQELAKEKVELFLREAPMIYNLQYDKQFLCCKNCVFTFFMQTRNVVRIEKKTRIHRYKIIIPVFKSNNLIFVSSDGTQDSVSFRREKHLDEVLEKLKTVCPQAQM